MSERSVATWEPLPSLCALGMLYTITRYRDTTYYSEWPKVAGAVIKARSRARHPHTVVLSLVRFSPSGAEELHIPSNLVVDHWTLAVESSSPLDFLSLYAMWTPFGRLINYKIMSTISVACDFTTKSGGI